ncbi:cation:proton antiporter [Rickettsia bellii]|uniref:Multisubunit Na+/H+ antiporter, MnhB subunit n=1 Tax=Rickettsia bellii (strain RML369-C) TaxID=336407 RepID=Q1RIA8_RICBR|nr:DUF4040 domain-containing protein [Rickettsia bellii]ABE04906.1 Multisubunit Na+/H+ antiporter, MnhB subunit [Rickettsia bellii RML369-C]ARD86787.1 cation:proton antiporter [Rickettsia bellii]
MFMLLNFDLSNYLLNLIVFLLVIISIKIILAKDLLEAIIYTSAFSLLIGVSYLLMDAPDVAMTEAALGACLSTCVYLNLLRKLPSNLKIIQRTKIIPASLICLLFIATLIYMGLELPDYGDEYALLHTHLTKYYVENTSKDIGIPSFVAAILASYRGYDTLGETSVILIAGISVLLVFSRKNDVEHSMQYNIPWSGHGMTKITKNISIFIVPYIILYSLYIQLNGEASPGGGFQAGVIFASSLIAYDLVYGSQKLNRYFSVNTLIIIAALGVMIYGFTGVISLFFNDNYLNYYSLTNFVNDSLTAQHIGIFAVEIGIGLTVAAIMYSIYNSFNNCE